MRWMIPLWCALISLAGCAGRAELGSQDLEPAQPGTSVCDDNLKKLTEMSIGIGSAIAQMRLEMAQSCAAIRQELGDSPPPVNDPTEPGDALTQCLVAGELLAAFGGISVNFPPAECFANPELESLCLDDCDHPSCPALCDGIARAFGLCPAPDVTVSGFDDILAVHFRAPASTAARSLWIAQVIADVYIPELGAIDGSTLEEDVCVDLWEDLIVGINDQNEGLAEAVDATTAVLNPVL